MRDNHVARAESYLLSLCGVKPNRRTGSPGNRDATNFFQNIIRPFGYEIDAAPFECLDYVRGEVLLAHSDRTFEVHIGPYSLGCDIEAELVAVSTFDELKTIDCRGRILLLKDVAGISGNG